LFFFQIKLLSNTFAESAYIKNRIEMRCEAHKLRMQLSNWYEKDKNTQRFYSNTIPAISCNVLL